MEIRTVACNNCGAALQIDDRTRFATCQHCGSQLEIKRTASTITAELLDSIDRRTASIAEDVHSLRNASALEQLDRDWSRRRESLVSSSRKGQRSIPLKSSGIVVMAIMGGFGLLWTAISCGITQMMAKAGAPGIVMVFPLFGILFIVAAILIGVRLMSAAETYKTEEARYEARRAELLAQPTDSARP